jgi:hypothetical protein
VNRSIHARPSRSSSVSTTTGFETLISRLLRHRIQCHSGMVDLVVYVGHQRCGGHGFALVNQQFVGLVAEDVALVIRNSLAPRGF